MDNSPHLSTHYKILGIIKNKHPSWLNITIHNQISITSQIPFSKVSCAYVRIRHQKSANKRRQVERSRRSSGAACWHVVGTRWRARMLLDHQEQRSSEEHASGVYGWRITCLFTGAAAQRGYNTTGCNTELLWELQRIIQEGVWTLNSF